MIDRADLLDQLDEANSRIERILDEQSGENKRLQHLNEELACRVDALLVSSNSKSEEIKGLTSEIQSLRSKLAASKRKCARLEERLKESGEFSRKVAHESMSTVHDEYVVRMRQLYVAAVGLGFLEDQKSDYSVASLIGRMIERNLVFATTRGESDGWALK